MIELNTITNFATKLIRYERAQTIMACTVICVKKEMSHFDPCSSETMACVQGPRLTFRSVFPKPFQTERTFHFLWPDGTLSAILVIISWPQIYPWILTVISLLIPLLGNHCFTTAWPSPKLLIPTLNAPENELNFVAIIQKNKAHVTSSFCGIGNLS